MPGMGSRIRARPLSRHPQCVARAAPATRHTTPPLTQPPRLDCRPPSGRMPPPAATVPPSRGAGKQSLFNALPTSRPARTGPSADSERPIALGVNFDKGVYVVRQLTPPSAQRPPTQNSLADPSPREPGAGSRAQLRADRSQAPASAACRSERPRSNTVADGRGLNTPRPRAAQAGC